MLLCSASWSLCERVVLPGLSSIRLISLLLTHSQFGLFLHTEAYFCGEYYFPSWSLPLSLLLPPFASMALSMNVTYLFRACCSWSISVHQDWQPGVTNNSSVCTVPTPHSIQSPSSEFRQDLKEGANTANPLLWLKSEGPLNTSPQGKSRNSMG